MHCFSFLFLKYLSIAGIIFLVYCIGSQVVELWVQPEDVQGPYGLVTDFSHDTTVNGKLLLG